MAHQHFSTHEDIIRDLISQGWTYDQISDHLSSLTGESRGLSARSLRRYCADRCIGRRSMCIDDVELERVLLVAIARVGHSYGRRSMQGLLASEGVQVSQSRLSSIMERIAPIQHAARQQDAHRLLNPIPYRARCYGAKLHLDQNEKCVMFGVTHVVAVDGYSRKIVGFITIPKKNAIAIYDLLFRPLLLTEGLWEQVRVDHGTEFSLLITAQVLLSPQRQNQDHQPVLQSLSRQNHRAECIWVEVNQRVNYPIKRVLVDMENSEEIDMENESIKFCVSWVTIRVMEDPIKCFIQSWNNHRIPGAEGGVPNILAINNNYVTHLSPSVIPSTAHIVDLHEENMSESQLCRDATYGHDPLSGHTELQELRERDILTLFPDFSVIFQDVIHGDAHLFRMCIHQFITITENFVTLYS